MAAIAGKGGSFKVGSDAVFAVESWEMSVSDEALETSGLGATARTFIGRGLPLGTGTATIRALDNSDTATAALRTAILDNTTPVTASLYESSTKYWGTSMVITGFSENVPVDGLVNGSVSFTMTGTISYN